MAVAWMRGKWRRLTRIDVRPTSTAVRNHERGILYGPCRMEVELHGEELFYTHVHLHGGPAPVRRFLPQMIDSVWKEKINPGKVFDLTLPLDQVAEGYRAMDERRAIKALLLPEG